MHDSTLVFPSRVLEGILLQFQVGVWRRFWVVSVSVSVYVCGESTVASREIETGT